MNKIFRLLVIISLAFISCQSPAKPERRIESYPVLLVKNFSDRIVPASPFVLQYLNRMDSTDQYTSYDLTPEERVLFDHYYVMLPLKFRTVMEQKVIAVFFVKNFIGGGMTDYLFDARGKLFTVMYFNPAILNTPLTDWISYRDNSSFVDDGKKIEVVVDCGKGHIGLVHTLIHEASHVYDYHVHVTPYVEPDLAVASADPQASVFVRGIWREYAQPADVYEFPNRKAVSAYGLGKPLDRSSAIDLVKDIRETPFSSLYGSASWAEDFAETFAWYWLRTALKVSYKVTVQQEEKELVSYSPTDNVLVKARYKNLVTLME